VSTTTRPQRCGNNYEYDGTLTARARQLRPGLPFSLDQGAHFTTATAWAISRTTRVLRAVDVAAPVVDAGRTLDPPRRMPVQTRGRTPALLQMPGPMRATPMQAPLRSPSSTATCNSRPASRWTGASTGLVYAQVYSSGVTNVAGNQGDILAQVGYGPVGSDPSAADAGWSWTAARSNATCLTCGNNYEYDAAFPAPGVGSYAMAARFSATRARPGRAATLRRRALQPRQRRDVDVAVDRRWLVQRPVPAQPHRHSGIDAGPIYGQVYWRA